MVSDAFGVSLEPFGISPDPRFMYFDSKLGREHQVLLESLRQGIGLAVITGEHGIGKTMLLHYLAAELDVANHLVAHISCLGSPSIDDIMGTFAVQIGLPGDLDVGGENRNQNSLSGMLGSAGVCGTTAILLLDDADPLSAETLSALSTMTRGDTKKGAAISIVLAGSPDLAPRLDASRDQFPRGRRDTNVSLTPLNPRDAELYILHRLRVAGGGDNAVFTPEAIARVGLHAKGNPQAINRMCRAAMIVSAAQSHRTVSVDAVDQVAPSSDGAGQGARASESLYARSSPELAATLDTHHSTDGVVDLPYERPEPRSEPVGSSFAPTGSGHASAGQDDDVTVARSDDRTVAAVSGTQQSSDSALPSGRDVAAAMAAETSDRPRRRARRGALRMRWVAVGALSAVAAAVLYVVASVETDDNTVARTDVPANAGIQAGAGNGLPEDSRIAAASLGEVPPPGGDERPLFGEQETTTTPSPLCGSPLEKAVFLGDIEAVAKLLDARADIDAPLAGGGTLLVVAANNGDAAMVRYLIERGADPSFGTIDVMDLGTDGLFPDADRPSGTMPAEPGSRDAVSGFSPASGTRDLAIGEGLDAGSRDTLARDLLRSSAGDGDTRVRRATRPTGYPPARPGSVAGAGEAATPAVGSEAGPGASPNLGVTPLIAAARRGHADVVDVLIGAGANVNVADTRGQTALMAAVDAGDGESTRLLLAQNPDIYAVDDMGRTALDIARQKGRPDIADVLASRTETLPAETTATRLAPNPPQVKPVTGEEPAAKTRPPEQPHSDRPKPASGGMQDRARVTQAQTYLRQLGYDPGPVDGVQGRKTKSAIVAFQRSRGLSADGKITASLINSLVLEANSRQAKQLAAETPVQGKPVKRLAPNPPQVKPVTGEEPAAKTRPPEQPHSDRPKPASGGMQDRARVTQAQTYLRQLGYDPGPVDGVQGRKTKSAIVAFQRSRGLSADGKVTASLINSLVVEANSRQAKPLAAETPAQGKPVKREDFFGTILSGLQNLRGLDFNSVESPARLNEYCGKNSDNWVYDNGTSRSVYCRDVLRRSKL